MKKTTLEKVTPLGDNLAILIECEYTKMHSWMAYATWYSITKNLPDASVSVICPRDMISGSQHFSWTYRISNVNLFQGKNPPNRFGLNKRIIRIPPHTMAVRKFNLENIGPAKVNSGELSTFVDYSEGCGKFVLSEWINKKEPFNNAVKKFYTNNITVNELKVLRLWEKSFSLYTVMI